jgi:tRNA 2-selenouridine synthase
MRVKMRDFPKLFGQALLFYLCGMIQTVDIHNFLHFRNEGVPLLDVRSPVEYEHAHIPGAHSFPLFDDTERSEVGTLYKQVSADAALMRGLSIAGPKMARFLDDALRLSPGKEVGIYCARGGKRSESMGWLLGQAGFRVSRLEGGYKRARRYYLDGLETGLWRFAVLGGHTGAGKTRILQALALRGAQVIDLEALARHRGSAFGAWVDNAQPSCEDFENRLAAQLLSMDASRIVWLENESRHIGRVRIPVPVWEAMRIAPLVQLEISRERRLEAIIEEYGRLPAQELKEAFQRIRLRMGPQFADAALRHLESGDLGAAASLALDYYDRQYAHNWLSHKDREVHTLQGETDAPDQLATALIALENHWMLAYGHQ